MARNVLILLGRRDQPTDGVEDYSEWLGDALERRGHSVRLLRVPWYQDGWRCALRWLRGQLAAARDSWVLMQFTHLTWSRRAFPVGALGVAWAVQRCRASLGVVIHDPWGFPGSRLRDRSRHRVQRWVMARLIREADRAFTTINPAVLAWVNEADRSRLQLLPVGSNIPPLLAVQEGRGVPERLTVVVFGVTGGRRQKEVSEIAGAMTRVAHELGDAHLVVLGRGSSEAELLLRRALSGTSVRLTVTGVMPPEEVSRWLGRANALLFVRGGVSSRRTTVVAAIAHGVPVIGYESIETAWPITEAGIALVPSGDVEGLSRAILHLARDPAWAATLRERSQAAYVRYFAWDRVAEAVESAMRCTESRLCRRR